MSNAVVYVTSDIHLGAVSRESTTAFLRWLEDAAANASRIVLNGDLFDYWFEYRRVIPRGYTRTLGLLARISDAGVRVDLTGGNHDGWGGTYFREELGLHYHPDPVRLDLAGHRTFLAHGDGLGPGDLGYRALRVFLRSAPFHQLFRWIHPDVGGWIADRASATSGRGAPSRRELARSERLARWALAELDRDTSLDLILLGHTHLPRMDRAESGGWYVNSGDWVRHRSWVELREGEAPVLHEHDTPTG
ncbi:MAG: UDP-2,3-diacylglucosamine diphosphatase [Longimicrobiales bacterium]|nr:UDP-2,3-diacylglucosamine diphosphatase [Longimicrobiales bacterium]